ncbi:MAG: AmmeMemoRadiSam system protein B [Elusimicrobiota bacterium]
MTPPPLRPLEASRVMEDGKAYLSLRDPEGFTDKLILLSPLDALIAARLNGRTPAAKIAKAVARQTGVAGLGAERVEELVKALDENLMLDSGRFREHKKSLAEDFRKASSRPAHLAGRSYAAKPGELEKSLDSHLEFPGGPGKDFESGAAPLTGLVAPHIDFERGAAAYAWSYREVLRSGLADLYVIFGVAHQNPPTPLILTRKDHETPFGAAKVDRELAAALADKAPYDLSKDELVHRNEHSIEFQAVYLKYAQKRLGGDFKILPILCSSCDLRGEEPGERTMKTLERLRDLLKDYPGKVCLLAGVDLAHIGPCFGDPENVTPKELKETLRRDKENLERLADRDAQGFLASVMNDSNRRKVCGVNALHAFSWLHRELFPKSKGETLYLGHAADPSGGEVTFASMAFR